MPLATCSHALCCKDSCRAAYAHYTTLFHPELCANNFQIRERWGTSSLRPCLVSFMVALKPFPNELLKVLLGDKTWSVHGLVGSSPWKTTIHWALDQRLSSCWLLLSSISFFWISCIGFFLDFSVEHSRLKHGLASTCVCSCYMHKGQSSILTAIVTRLWAAVSLCNGVFQIGLQIFNTQRTVALTSRWK